MSLTTHVPLALLSYHTMVVFFTHIVIIIVCVCVCVRERERDQGYQRQPILAKSGNDYILRLK